MSLPASLRGGPSFCIMPLMLLPGHLAGGYLAARVYLKLSHLALTSHQTSLLLWLGVLAGILPDFDWLRMFWAAKSFKPKDTTIHRRYFSHLPLFWVAVCVILYVLAQTIFMRAAVIVFFLAVMSHMLFDSLEFGLMWLWPFKKECYAVFEYRPKINWAGRSFWDYWLMVVVQFPLELPGTFFGELFVSILGLIVFLHR